MPMKTHSKGNSRPLTYSNTNCSSKGIQLIKDKNDECVIISVVKGEIQIGEETISVKNNASVLWGTLFNPLELRFMLFGHKGFQ